MKCDVLVVGAGASGSVAALTLADTNLNVVVIEREKEIGSHHGERIDITEDVGLKHIVQELNLPIEEKTNKSKWFSPNHKIILQSKIHDLYFKRGPCKDSFEILNMDTSIKKGVDLITDTKIHNIKSEGNSIKTITIKKNKEFITIKPKIVIAADGTNSEILNLFKHKIKIENSGKLVAYGIFGKTTKIEPSITHIFFDSKYIPGGYFFLAKSKNADYIASIVLDNERINKQPKEYFKTFVRHNQILQKILLPFKEINSVYASSTIDRIDKISIGNILFVGEAARLLDPLFGYGMRNSIISGYTAAKISQEYILKAENKILDNYSNTLLPILNEIKESYNARTIFNRLDNNDFDEIFSILSSDTNVEKKELSQNIRLGLEVLSPIFE